MSSGVLSAFKVNQRIFFTLSNPDPKWVHRWVHKRQKIAAHLL